MKIFIAIALTAILCVSGAALVVSHQNALKQQAADQAAYDRKKAESDAILAVLNANSHEVSKFREYGKGLSVLSAHRALTKELEAIDTTACPEDFRLAWADYVAANRRLDAAGIFSKSEAADSVKDSFSKCKVVATDHGITFTD